MKMTTVVSSNINAIGYDLATQDLHVEFKNGKTFKYMEVSAQEALELGKAQSVGRHFNRHIKAVKVGLEVVICITDDLEKEAQSKDEKIELLRETVKLASLLLPSEHRFREALAATGGDE